MPIPHSIWHGKVMQENLYSGVETGLDVREGENPSVFSLQPSATRRKQASVSKESFAGKGSNLSKISVWFSYATPLVLHSNCRCVFWISVCHYLCATWDFPGNVTTDTQWVIFIMLQIAMAFISRP